MSGLLNKVKDAVTGHHTDPAHSKTSTTGATHSTTGTHSTGNPLTGTHSTGNPMTGTHDTSGPHRSDMANRMDPRVDSDNDGHRGPMSGSTGTGLTGATGSHNTSGPHRSDMANRMDPRVDSDNDGRRGPVAGSTGTGLTGMMGTSSHTHGTHDTSGPHRSDMANRMDPRVDSDNDGHRGPMAGSTGTGYTGTSMTGTSTTGTTTLIPGTDPHGKVHGHHTTVTGELLDPHVAPQPAIPSHDTMGEAYERGGMTGTNTTGTGMTGTGMTGTGMTGSNMTGTGQSTGPHNSNIMNKLDPRVDSDRDGSRLH